MGFQINWKLSKIGLKGVTLAVNTYKIELTRFERGGRFYTVRDRQRLSRLAEERSIAA